MNKDIVTSDLTAFGSRELKMLEQLLRAMREKGLPQNFDNSNVVPMMNRHSGCVFLTNENYEVAMMNGDDLEVWHTCSYCGHEGFLEDFEHDTNGNEDCRENMLDAGVERFNQ